MTAQLTTWENLGHNELKAWIQDATKKQQAFYKANADKWDNDRFVIFEAANKDIKAAIEKENKLAAAKAIYDEMSDYQKRADEPDRKVPFQTGTTDPAQEPKQNKSLKSLGEMFTDEKAYKSIGDHRNQTMPYRFELNDFEVKTTMTTAAGYAPPNDRSDIVIPAALRTPMVADVIPVIQTANSVISWMEETTAITGTKAQVAIAEGNAKFENTSAFTERTSVVETVGTWLPVTVQQLDDVPGIQAILNNRLLDYLQRIEEDFLLNGTGSTPQIEGFLAKTGTNSLTRTTETNIDIVLQAIQSCRVTGFAEPDAIIMHPNNFTPIAAYKSTTGEYSFSPVSDNGGVTRLWGKPLILTTAITAGTCLVGAFRAYSAIWRKMGMSVQVGLNSDDFTKNKRTLLAEYREALTIYRAAAFTKIASMAS